MVLLFALFAVACERPFVGRDGTISFQEKGSGNGATVLTANGVEFRDSRNPPTPQVRRSAFEPWRAPIGFILPKDNRFTHSSQPTVLATTGLGIVLRASDTRVPSWGGEVLVRIDVLAPAAEGTARWGENVAIVVDGKGPHTARLVDEALAQLAGRDRVTVLDAQGKKVLTPPMPASNRSLVAAAVANRLRVKARGPRDLAGALRAAAAAIHGADVNQRVLVLTDAVLVASDVAAASELSQRGVQVGVVHTEAGDDLGDRVAQIREMLPASGVTTFRDVKLTFEGTPAPSHVIEASGGEARWILEAGELLLGNVRAGEARTEIVRVTVPAWVSGESFVLTVKARFDDLAYGGPREIVARVPSVYDDDIERIARSRHGDVIAYASAMATLRRLDAAFTSESITSRGGLRRVAELHAKSMGLLARDMKDAAMQEQADTLVALLRVTR